MERERERGREEQARGVSLDDTPEAGPGRRFGPAAAPAPAYSSPGLQFAPNGVFRTAAWGGTWALALGSFLFDQGGESRREL